MSALVVLGGIGAWIWWIETRPDTRKPGESLADVTSKLDVALPANAPMPRFSDVTTEAGLGSFVSFVGDRSSQLPEDMGSGAAWGDFDNDGDDDLFMVSSGGRLDLPGSERAPSLLFENLGDGTFAQATFPETRIVGMGAAWGDYDSDGRLDLVVTGYRSLLLFRNTEQGFEAVDAFEGFDGYWAGATWGDFDNDRDLDLYVCGYVRYEESDGSVKGAASQYGRSVPFTLNPATYEPERNLLFRNDGGRFVETAAELGVSNPEGRSLGAIWHDFDQDGRLDLYVANDISDNALYLNRRDTFEDAGLAAWVADYRGAMGIAVGDWNRDGDDDLFVTHWVAQENALYDSRLRDSETGLLTFSDIAASVGLAQIALPMIGWGTELADFDADGWLDIVVSNGSTFETKSEPKKLQAQRPFLFWNQEGKAFHDIAPLAPSLAEAHVGRGLALSDFDLDGDIDVLIIHYGEGAKLLRNDIEQQNWIAFRVRTPTGAPALGATITVNSGELALRRTLGGASYLSQSTTTAHVGLGEATTVESVVVEWLGGEQSTYSDLATGAVWELTQGRAEAGRIGLASEPAAVDELDEKSRILAFWKVQREAMNTLKLGRDCQSAIPLFEKALALDSKHEDSRYYLAQCLAEGGDIDRALVELDHIRRANSQSHRASKQWGTLRAIHAEGTEDLLEAEKALERAIELNAEETGALLVLGEIELLLNREEKAQQLFEWACSSNPRAVQGFLFRAYLAWKGGDVRGSESLLELARKAAGPQWKPEGSVAEGDVTRLVHREDSPLSPIWRRWRPDGGAETLFTDLGSALKDAQKTGSS